MFSEDQLRPISALQHLVFCERRCALVHLEGIWAENTFTAEGTLLHEHVHELASTSLKSVRRVTGLPVRSFRHGLVGQCDVVEFITSPASAVETLYPVEFKRGTQKRGDCDDVQLCAEALCLEEMLGREVPAGAVYYATPRRRREVLFSPELRQYTVDVIGRLHNLFAAGQTPAAEIEKRCQSCSLLEFCLPQAQARRVEAYLLSIFHPPPQ